MTHRLDALIELWQGHGHGYHVLRAVTAAQQGALLKVRKSSLGLLMAASEGSNRPLAFVEDTAVPPERLAAYTSRFAEILDAHQMRAGFYGHCSVGCLHIRPFVDLSRPDEIARMRAVAVQIKDLVSGVTAQMRKAEPAAAVPYTMVANKSALTSPAALRSASSAPRRHTPKPAPMSLLRSVTGGARV